MAALEGQHLVAEFRCGVYQMHQVAWTTFHHRSSYECGECKEGSVHLALTLTTIFCRCQQIVQLPPVPKPIQLKKITSKNGHKMFQRKLYNNYVFCVVYCLLCCVLFVVYYSTVLCQQSNANFSTKFFFLIQKFIFRKLLNVFFQCCRFINVCMQCSVDVTESLVEPLRF